MSRVINSDTLLGAVLALVGGYLLQASYSQNAAVFLLPGDAPPFLVPQLFLYLWICIALVIFSLGLRRGGAPISPQRWGAIFAAFITVVLAAALMKSLGYLIVAPIAVFITIWLLEFRSYVLALVVSIGITVLLYFLLSKFAGLPLPKIPGLEI